MISEPDDHKAADKGPLQVRLVLCNHKGFVRVSCLSLACRCCLLESAE